MLKASRKHIKAEMKFQSRFLGMILFRGSFPRPMEFIGQGYPRGIFNIDARKIVSNDLMIAGMLMSISFPVIADEWVKLDSLASSSRNDAFGDPHV